MTSWQLFRYLNIFKHHSIEQHPVYQHEHGRAIDWTRLGERVTRVLATVTPVVVLAYLVLLWLDSPLRDYLDLGILIAGGLFLLTPSLAPWSLALGLLLGPTVAGERERGTWVLMQLVPAGTTPVLLAKLRAAAWPLRYPLHLMRHIWLVMAFPIGLGVMNAGTRALGFHSEGRTLFDQVCASGGLTLAAGGLLLVGGMLLFFADRMHQLLLMTLAALAASTTTRSARLGLIGAVVAALLVWLAETAGAAILVLQLPGRFVYTDMNLLALLVLGPAGSYAIDLPPGSALAAALVTFGVRELAIRALWRWSAFAARRLYA